jgi:hypothetical protein
MKYNIAGTREKGLELVGGFIEILHTNLGFIFPKVF